MASDSGNLFEFEQDEDVLIVIPRDNAGSLIDRQVYQEWEQLLSQFDEPPTKVVLDIERMAYFGSIVLEWMIQAWRELHAKGGTIAICNASEVGREILQIAKFDSLWPICETREEALKAVREKS